MLKVSDAHKTKYAQFIKMLSASKGKVQAVAVASPDILGDNYEEITTNLGLLAESGLAILIAGPMPS